MRFRDIKVRTKIIILSVFLLSAMAAIGLISLVNQNKTLENNLAVLEDSIKSDFDNNIKQQVETAVSILNNVYHKYETGEMTLEEAKSEGADLLRGLSYGEGGYFWADTYEGDNVVLLGKKRKAAIDMTLRILMILNI